MDKDKHDITMEIIQDGEPNAYLYEDSKLVRSYDIFYRWINQLIKMKQDNKNSLTKMLASSSWGHLNDVKTIYCDDDKFNEINSEYTISTKASENPDYFIYNYDVRGDDDNIEMMYELIDLQNPVYKLPLRLLPFITSYSRCRMASVIDFYKLESNVIRIHTDGVVLDKKVKFSDRDLIPEDKTTGKIVWKNLNEYAKL